VREIFQQPAKGQRYATQVFVESVDPEIWQYVYIATRKMTFTLPDDLADQFVKRVAARNRSRDLAQALARTGHKCLDGRSKFMVRSCRIGRLRDLLG
jgi:hypothetical protein